LFSLFPHTDLFGTFGTPIKKDVQGNIDKLTTVYNQNVPRHANLIHMLKSELPRGGMATESLMWLRRGLHFFCEFFELLRHDFENSKVKDDLKEYIRKAYDVHLRRHHNWFIQQTFKVFSPLYLCRFLVTGFYPSWSDKLPFYTYINSFSLSGAGESQQYAIVQRWPPIHLPST
jgi:Glycolipid transfer protein (GLTP).